MIAIGGSIGKSHLNALAALLNPRRHQLKEPAKRNVSRRRNTEPIQHYLSTQAVQQSPKPTEL